MTLDEARAKVSAMSKEEVGINFWNIVHRVGEMACKGQGQALADQIKPALPLLASVPPLSEEDFVAWQRETNRLARTSPYWLAILERLWEPNLVLAFLRHFNACVQAMTKPGHN